MEPVEMGSDGSLLRCRQQAVSAPTPSSSGVNAQAIRLTVRQFKEEDAAAIQSICKRHFRSLCIPAVQYYCYEHFRDLIALLIIGSLFVTWGQMFSQIILFVTYLVVRARVELELYIYRSCPDLLDIPSHYIRGPSNRRSNFWVAEIEREVPTDKKTDDGDHPSGPAGETFQRQVVGCVGCRPARDDPTVAQLLRLVVSEESRRMRFGSRLLAQFEQSAKDMGYREVRLYTNNLSTNHIRFIGSHGYAVVHCISRALMRGALIQWRKSLVDGEASPKGGAAVLVTAQEHNASLLGSPPLPDNAPDKAKLIAGMTLSGSSNNLAALAKMSHQEHGV